MKNQNSIRQPKDRIQRSTDFLFEACALKRLQRTGWQILGGGNTESVAEHSFMVAVISFLLAKELNADMKKTLTMALFHDFSESRIGDVYKLADLYLNVDEKKARKDAYREDLSLDELMDEYEKKECLESIIVHDADNLALILELKQLMENGNVNAKEWFEANKDRLKLRESVAIFEEIRKSNSQDWWKKEREKIHKGYRK